jgi:hypothetical protein
VSSGLDHAMRRTRSTTARTGSSPPVAPSGRTAA